MPCHDGGHVAIAERGLLVTRLALALLVSITTLAHAEVRLIAHAKVPGTATDLSGLAGTLENGGAA